MIAEIFIELGANADLHGTLWIDQAFLRRMVEHGAVVEGRAVGVGIGVRIEMHQRHFAEMLRVRAQQRQRDVVVAAESQHAFAAGQQFFRVRLQLVGQILRVAKGVNQIAAVDDVQTLAQIEVPRPAAAFPRQIGRDLTDSARSQAAAWAA